jgi:hypothetical protein
LLNDDDNETDAIIKVGRNKNNNVVFYGMGRQRNADCEEMIGRIEQSRSPRSDPFGGFDSNQVLWMRIFIPTFLKGYGVRIR